MALNPARIMIVGCGPGSPAVLTDAARRAVAAAEVLFGSPRLLKLFDEGPCLRLTVDGDIAWLLERIAEQHAAGRHARCSSAAIRPCQSPGISLSGLAPSDASSFPASVRCRWRLPGWAWIGAMAAGS